MGVKRAQAVLDKSEVKGCANRSIAFGNCLDLSAEGESGIPIVAVKCVDIWRNTGGEAGLWSVTDAEERKRGEQTGLDTPGSPRRKR